MTTDAILRRAACAALAFAAAIVFTEPAFAWGDTGYRIIGTLAVEALPATLPAFLRTSQSAADIGEWSREPDRWRNAGRIHDDMRNPGHFVDVGDDGRILGGPRLDALPPTRSAFSDALHKAGTNYARAGFLPYNIADGWQQLVKDFAYWRADKAALRLDRDPAHQVWLEGDLRRREEQTRIDLGIWGHYVGDGSQPLHVSVHYNGWGRGVDPHGFTIKPIHVP